MDRALTIGLSDYGWLKQNLPGCLNDCDAWTEYLAGALTLAKNNLRTLKDGQATREAILAGVHWLLADAAPGDERVLTFAGHGARRRRDGQLQETLVAHPGAGERPYDDFMIYDVDLASVIDGSGFAAGARLTLIFDSCNSGGMMREIIDDGSRPLEDLVLPRCLALPEDRENQSFKGWSFVRTLSALEKGATAPRLLVAAAQAHESAWDASIPQQGGSSVRHGVFTYWCLQALGANANRPASEVVAEATRNIRFPQTPQLLGDESRFGQPLF